MLPHIFIYVLGFFFNITIDQLRINVYLRHLVYLEMYSVATKKKKKKCYNHQN